MNKYLKNIVIIVLFVFIAIYFLGFNKNSNEWSENFIANNIAGSPKITCTYKHVLNSSYSDSKITQALPPPEVNPLVFTFSDIDTKNPQLSTIDATRSITTVPIITLVSREDKIVFIDGSENYITVHTIYPDRGIATYTKNVDFFGIPSASLSMGTCVGY